MIKFIPWVLRRRYPEERLSSLVDVTVSSEHEAVTINCQGLPSADVWMEITNRSPFPLTVTGIEVDLYWMGTIAKLVSVRPNEIEPHQKSQLFVKGTMSGRQAEHVLQHLDVEKVRVMASIYIKSDVRRFEKRHDQETRSYRLLRVRKPAEVSEPA